MSIYADSSFFVSLYLFDVHSARAEQLMDNHPNIWLTSFNRAEFVHAVFQHVFHGKISLQNARDLYSHFESDRQSGLWLDVEVPELTFDLCTTLAQRHVSKVGAKTLDSLHVASALQLKADTFLTFDKRQAKLAEAEGLRLLLSQNLQDLS